MTRRAVAVAVTAAALLTGGIALVVRADGDTAGTGTQRGSFDRGDEVVLHRVGVAAGSVVTVAVAPEPGLDAAVAFAASAADTRRIRDAYDSIGGLDTTPVAAAFPTVDRNTWGPMGETARTFLRTDVGFAGEPERMVLAVPFAVEVAVVVVPFDRDEDAIGSFELTVERFDVDVDVDDGATSEELLRAALDDRAIPRPFRDLARELVGDD